MKYSLFMLLLVLIASCDSIKTRDNSIKDSINSHLESLYKTYDKPTRLLRLELLSIDSLTEKTASSLYIESQMNQAEFYRRVQQLDSTLIVSFGQSIEFDISELKLHSRWGLDIKDDLLSIKNDSAKLQKYLAEYRTHYQCIQSTFRSLDSLQKRNSNQFYGFLTKAITEISILGETTNRVDTGFFIVTKEYKCERWSKDW